MLLRSSIQGYAHKEMISHKEFRPLLIQKRTIRLDCIENLYVVDIVFLLKFDGFFKKRKPAQRRLASLIRNRAASLRISQNLADHIL